MTDEQRKNLFLVGGGIAIGIVGGYYIGKVVGGNEATQVLMRKLGMLSEAAKTMGEFPMKISDLKTGTEFLCKVVPEATDEFANVVRIF